MRVGKIQQIIRQFEDFEPGHFPEKSHLKQLLRAWKHAGASANFPFLFHIAQHATKTGGTILECGTGCSTILLSLLAGRRGVPIISLERNPERAEAVNACLREFDLPGVTVIPCDLLNYGEFIWYDAREIDLPGNIQLVVCDDHRQQCAPYGLYPTLRPYMEPNAIILIDHHGRKEKEAIHRWHHNIAPLQVREHGLRFRFAEIHTA